MINELFNIIKSELKSISCNHELVFIRNVCGDEINLLNARSIWKCKKCKKYFYKNELVKDEYGNPMPDKETLRLVKLLTAV